MININTIEKKLNVILVDKAPTLPKWLVKFIVWIMPVLILLGIAGYVLLILTIVVSNPRILGTWLNLISYFAWTVFYFYSFTYIFNRTKKGWKLMFYASLVSEVLALIYLIASFSLGLLISNLISVAISFYFLFQIRASYNK